MKKYKWIIILANLILLLVLFNYSMFKKEKTITSGELVLLELVPVDPRSLMQGDYMNLRYAMASDMQLDTIPPKGFWVVQKDAKGIAKKVRLQENTTPLNENEYLIEYRSYGYRGMNIGADSFFFQEGDAEKYEEAKYGGLRIDTHGNSILIGLYDENGKFIE